MPSSLTMLLPSALGFSPHPPVSVYGTGILQTIAAFLDSQLTCFPTSFRSTSRLQIEERICQLFSYLACTGLSIPGSRSLPVVPTVLLQDSTGISTCYPSTTSFDLALGPDLPRADQLYSGNLRYSAGRIPTFFSLLIPAFSLLKNPQLLPVLLRLFKNAPLPIEIHQFQSFGSVFQPRTFSAQDLSTSELLRTL